MTKKVRLNFPDSVKGIAVLFMIQVHLMELFANERIYYSNLGLFSLFLGGIPAAPVFMVVMGYFLAFGKKSSSQMFKRGLQLFVGGIVLNIGLNAHLLINIVFYNWDFNPWHFIFGVDILPLAGLSLMSIALIQKSIKNKYWIYFIIAFVVASLSQLFDPLQFEDHSLRYILAFFVGGTSWSFFPLIPWLAYPLLGYGFNLMTKQINIEVFIKSNLAKLLFGVLALALLLTFPFGIAVSTNLVAYYHHNLVFFLWSTTFMSVWFFVLYLINQVTKNSLTIAYLQFIGKYVTVFYVIQWLIIGNISTTIYKTQGVLALIFWFIGITVVSSALTYAWVQYRSKKTSNYQ